jgi:hypothetical protein
VGDQKFTTKIRVILIDGLYSLLKLARYLVEGFNRYLGAPFRCFNSINDVMVEFEDETR